METENTPKPWYESIFVKIVIIGIIILGLMIPSVMISELVRERANRKSEVVREVSSKWGQLQTIAGPYIALPYYEAIKKTETSTEWVDRTLNYFPSTLDIRGDITPVVRQRSIFRVMLYESKLVLKGTFRHPSLEDLQITPDKVVWEKAAFYLGLTDLSGISDAVEVRIGDTTMTMTAGNTSAINFPGGLMTRIPAELVKSSSFDFEITLQLKGSEGLYFSPVAKNTTVNLTSSWPSPKFEGQFLPDTSQVSPQGFSASWKILDINRQLSHQWTNETTQMLSPVPADPYRGRYPMETTAGPARSTLGVELIDTVDHYTKNQRTVKYAFLLITLTFVVYFFFEVLKKQKVHVLHYGLIGAALVIFFILLLSLSEHLGFDLAYLIAGSATILLITFYSMSIFQQRRDASLVGMLLLFQFGFIYTILQLEDFALLVGSIALFVILAVIMYLTKRIRFS